MAFKDNPLYLEDVAGVANLNLPWEQMENQTILITGASGMIGSFLIDVLMHRNQKYGMNCKIIAVGRNEVRAKERFCAYWDEGAFRFLSHDINEPILDSEVSHVDYMIHAASNTHPVAYASDPIGTVTANMIGTDHLLAFAADHQCRRFLFLSSVEIYGENRGDVEYFQEDYCGYINCNTLRAGYPESKRCGEALCQAYKKQKNMDVVIARLARTYGPTMLESDTKAISQFLKKGIAKEDIVLKSEGTQLYSYTYVADAISGILTVLLKGKSGEAYNIADKESDIMLKDLAAIIANIAGTKVVFELPDVAEAAGYSKATKAIMGAEKIGALGWQAAYHIAQGITRTCSILRK